MGQPIKFYTDEHVAKAVVQGLRQRGADVLNCIGGRITRRFR